MRRPIEDYSLPLLWARIKELEEALAELEGQLMLEKHVTELLPRMVELEARLEAVLELPDKWVERPGDYATKRADCECADELRKAAGSENDD
jgi:hypothetical protein